MSRLPGSVFVSCLIFPFSSGVAFNSTVPQSSLDAHMVREILRDQKIGNAEINAHEDITVDDFIDALHMKHRKYVSPWSYCVSSRFSCVAFSPGPVSLCLQ